VSLFLSQIAALRQIYLYDILTEKYSTSKKIKLSRHWSDVIKNPYKSYR